MKSKVLQRLGIAIFGLSLTASALAAVTSKETGVAPAVDDKKAAYDIPLVNWSAPQFFNPVKGVSSNMPGFASGGITAKAAFNLAAFVPISPCRLVDTRGAFSPVYAGGEFAANEVRVYRVAGNCGVLAGANRIKAVSIAVTTLPTPASGDIEVVSESATLGGTVVMVIQAGQWNSATTLTAVDADGDFKVQLRGTTGHVVIDINGYFAATDALNNDYIQVVGSYVGGGLFLVANSSASGAAISAVGPSSNTQLAVGPDAIVAQGGLRVPGAGVGTNDFAYVHRVTAANSCVVDDIARTVLDHPDLNGKPGSIAHVGQPIYQFPGNIPPGAPGEQGTFLVIYYLGDVLCGSTSMLNKWTLTRSGVAPIAANLAFPVIVIKP